MTSKEEKDLLLIENYKNGDINSFKSLIEKYKTYTYLLINKFTNQTDNRFLDDCYQDIWVKVLTKVNSFTKGCFQSWLYIIARNECVNLYRKEKLKINFDNYEDTYSYNIKDEPYDFYKDYVLKVIYDNMHEILNNTQYQVVSYRLMGCSYKEISERIKVPYGTCLPAYTESIFKMRKFLISQELLDPDDFISSKNSRKLYNKKNKKHMNEI